MSGQPQLWQINRRTLNGIRPFPGWDWGKPTRDKICASVLRHLMKPGHAVCGGDRPVVNAGESRQQVHVRDESRACRSDQAAVPTPKFFWVLAAGRGGPDFPRSARTFAICPTARTYCAALAKRTRGA